jgi:hypothetical protein
MKAIKLTKDQYQRSLKSKNMNHLWLYCKSNTTQRTHNNSIFLSRTIGQPIACLVTEYNSCICDEDIEILFGKGTFYDGGVSPIDKENMMVDSFYVKFQ